MRPQELLGEQQPPLDTRENFYRTLVIKGLATASIGSALFLGISGCAANGSDQPKPTPTHTSDILHTPSASPTPEAPQVPPETKGLSGEWFATLPTWEEDYSKHPDGTIDTKKWNIFKGVAPGNHEAQYYTDSLDNLRVENGVLSLEAQIQTEAGHKYTSARIDTEGKEDFLYGKFEITAKLPNGVGSWPAAWLLPSDNIYKTANPNTNFHSYYVDGEIDILEAIGSQQNTIYGIAHSLNIPTNPNYPAAYYNTIVVPDADTQFHTYGLEWSPTNLTFSVDGQVFYTLNKEAGYDFKKWPYDQKYYLILNLAEGGSWAGRDTKTFPPDGVDTSKLPSSFDVKSVKYFPYVQKTQ
ncbi:MAG TPA: glycoside hydrolase family 16 protein [Candidatus Microsaccharimonas sp.]|jgi:beta-glucanase (GH16 family)